MSDMPQRQFPLASLFSVTFWIAGGLALGRLAWHPELGDSGYRLALCTLAVWTFTGIGALAGQVRPFAIAGLCVGILIAITLPDRHP